MKLFIFSFRGAYGEYIYGIIHNTVEEALDFTMGHGKSLKDLGWKVSDLIYYVEVKTDKIGVAFEGGGDNG